MQSKQSRKFQRIHWIHQFLFALWNKYRNCRNHRVYRTRRNTIRCHQGWGIVRLRCIACSRFRSAVLQLTTHCLIYLRRRNLHSQEDLYPIFGWTQLFAHRLWVMEDIPVARSLYCFPSFSDRREQDDELLQQKNIYYRDLVAGKIIQPLKIRLLQKDAFIRYMKSIGKLGGQNKVPRLSNDRNIADGMRTYLKD